MLANVNSSLNLHRTGKQTVGGHKQKLVCTRTQEKGAVTPEETDSDLPVSVQESLVVGQRWPAAGSGAPSVAVRAWDLLKEVAIIFITSTIVWSQVKQQGRNIILTINRKLDSRFTRHGPTH